VTVATADPAAAAIRVTVSNRPASRLGTDRPDRPVAPDFVGVSMDWCSIRTYTRDGGTPVIANLLRALDPARPDIRIGGDGTDAPCHGRRPRGPTRPEAAAVAGLARAVDAHLILDINLASHSRRLARRQSRLILRALGRRRTRREVQAIEIGNEPDRYRAYGSALPKSELGPYIDRYLRDFGIWAAIARGAFGDRSLTVAGPSLGRYGLPWISGANVANFRRLLAGRGHPGLVTFHSYPLLGSARCPSRLCGSIPDLLLDHASAGLASRLAPYVGLARGVPVRIDEMNSVTQGGRDGVSNTLAAALWAADTLFEFARAGIAGVNLHTFSAARYALFSHLAGGGWVVHPDYYGLLLFERAAPAGSRLLHLRSEEIARPGAEDVKVWATRGRDHRTRITVINKDLVEHTIELAGPGVPDAATVTLQRLSAAGAPYDGPACPASFAGVGLCATGGVSLGGATFGPPARGVGGDRTETGTLGSPALGTCGQLTACVTPPPYASAHTVAVPVAAGSAVLLTGVTPPSRRSNR
jgi:hypothetical protein